MTFFSSLKLVLIYLFGHYIICEAHGRNFSDTFNEELVLKPLPNGYIFSHFQFTTTWDVQLTDEGAYSHYRLFPKSLGEILEKYKVQELHLSLTQGLWRHKLWGYPFHDAPPGAELWAWFEPDTENIDETWIGLSHALSGLFCSSLNFIDSTNTVVPKLSFRPIGTVRNSSLIRYAAIPREIVCTENLTPWKKLLPCLAMAGVSTLLNSRQLFDVHYHSLQVDVHRPCHVPSSSCRQSNLKLNQRLALVSQTSKYLQDKPDWSLKKLYGTMLFRHCPLAINSTVFVDLSQNKSDGIFSLSPEPTKVIKSNDERSLYALYDIHTVPSPFNIAATFIKSPSIVTVKPPPLYVNRYIKERGKRAGTIHMLIHHTNRNSSMKVLIVESIPHFAMVFVHTLKVICNEKPVSPDLFHLSERTSNQQPFLLEMIVTLPPNSLTEVTVEFERIFLKWNAYPPDANHGFYVGSAIVTVLEPKDLASNDCSNIRSCFRDHQMRIYTDVLLLPMPTPDFSMPYNVICLVCTVMAFAFGPIHNVTTKRLMTIKPKRKKFFFF